MAGPTAGFLHGRGTPIAARGWGGRSSGSAWRLFAVCVLALLLAPPLLGTPAPVGAASWQSTGQLPASYAAALAALLPDGRVLAVAETNGALYSFDDNTWSATAPLPQNARGAELIVLSDGRALLTGGAPSTFLRDPFELTRQAQRFDPAKNSWTKGADMPTGRADHTMTALPNGKVLVVGGLVGGLSPRQPTTTVGAVELYDPATDSWTPTAPLIQARYGHSATLLADGRVLVAGGAFSKTVNSENAAAEVVNSAEIYDPATGKWQAAAPLPATPPPCCSMGRC